MCRTSLCHLYQRSLFVNTGDQITYRQLFTKLMTCTWSVSYLSWCWFKYFMIAYIVTSPNWRLFQWIWPMDIFYISTAGFNDSSYFSKHSHYWIHWDGVVTRLSRNRYAGSYHIDSLKWLLTGKYLNCQIELNFAVESLVFVKWHTLVSSKCLNIPEWNSSEPLWQRIISRNRLQRRPAARYGVQRIKFAVILGMFATA